MSPSNLSFTDAFTSEIRQTFYQEHKALAHVMHLILFLLPFAGVVFRGLVGGVLGLTLFLICYYLTPSAWFALHDHSRV
ncbi:MAG: hypothetical protein R3B37_13995 [Nitrospira sp.]|nr:hypothetical protein [Nitrospira sp.]